MPYALSCSLLFMALVPLRKKVIWLAAIFLLTVLQMLPLKIAYFDENTERSTRLSAADWINKHIQKGENICVGTSTLAPFDAPPFDLPAYAINNQNCVYYIRVEREPNEATPLNGFKLLKQFRPRFTFQEFPLVYSHINPQISIYRRDQTLVN
jgi:hypothetical protein